MPRRRRIPHVIRELARETPGPRFSSEIVCQDCGCEWISVYAKPLLTFRCPECHRRSGIRESHSDEDDVPVPQN